MDCERVRRELLDHQRERLAPALARDVGAHLEACAACAHEAAAEQTLTEALERRLPWHPASLALKRRLASQWPVPARAASRPWTRWRRALVPAVAAALLLVVVPLLYIETARIRDASGAAPLVTEAVNDHVRVLQRPRPLDVESGGIHEVKPWFTGRLDFAPVVAFEGDERFPLQGGAVAYFVDRPAALFAYRRRLHPISLFVFRSAGLPWPARGTEPIGGADAYAATRRGFNVILWRSGDLGYALVSDLDRRELHELASRLAAKP